MNSGRPRRGRSQQVKWHLKDYAFFKKCGEITAAPDKKSFGLNCIFCPDISLQFELFVEHIRAQHTKDIRELYLNDIEEEQREQATQTEHTARAIEADTVTATATPLADSVTEFIVVETNKKFDKGTNPKEFDIGNEGSEGVAAPESVPDSKSKNQRREGLVAVAAKCVEIGVETQKQQQQLQPFTAATTTTTTEEVEDEINCCLVYIMEEKDDMTEEMQMEEETVDPFEMSNRKNIDGVPFDAVPVNVTDEASAIWNSGHKIQSGLTDSEDSFELNIDLGNESAKKLERKKKSKMREVLHNKDIISYILDTYRKNEKLWNPKHPDYKYNARRSVFNELSEPLLRDKECALNGAEIFTILKELRCRYRRDLTKFKARKGKYKSKLWYFDKLEFLRNIIENKRADREAKLHLDVACVESEQTTDSNSDSSKPSVQSRKVLSYIIEAYKRAHVLWNPQHAGYLSQKKSEIFHDIAAQLLEDMGVSISGEECNAEVQKLCTRYRKELRILNKCKGLYMPKLWCFEQMEFLRETLENQVTQHMNKRKNMTGPRTRSSYIRANNIAFKSVEEQLNFVEIYHTHTALWDVDHPDYRSTTYRDNALNEMLQELNSTLNINATMDELQKSIYQLRKDFSAEKQKKLSGNCEENDNGTDSSVVYAKLAEFLELNLGPFRCEICNELIKTSDQYKVHKAAHNGSLPFICTLCGKGFQMPGNLTVHIRRHKQDFPYSCGVCEKRFATSTEVAIHMRTHTGERPYICDLCGKSFKTWSFFDIHRRTHLQQSNFLCPICDKAFYEKNRFTDHMNVHLNIRKHACKECGKSFTTFANLQKHNELHLEVKKYKCSLCSKRFAQFASLRWHRRTAHERAHAHAPCELKSLEQ